MGFYLRKSTKIGPIRINLSKSGVGASFGVKGARIGTGPKGNYIHLGRNGIYYRQTLRKNNNIKKNGVKQNSDNKNLNSNEKYNFVDIESAQTDSLVDSSYESILNDINYKYKKKNLTLISILLIILISMYDNSFSALLLVVPVISIIDSKRKKIYLAYDIDEETELKLQDFYNVFNEIFKVKKIWHISSSANLSTNLDKKVNAGAGSLIRRSRVNIKMNKIPKHFKTNIKTPCIPVGKQILYFFPDRILVIEKKSVGTVNYNELIFNYSNTRMIESEIVPSDSKIVDYTWQYVNKNGNPDKRYKDNRKLPIALYSAFHFKSDSGLNELINLSKPDLGLELYDAINSISTKLLVGIE